jgi:hypothetical protein
MYSLFMDLKMVCEDVDWSQMTSSGACEHGNGPLGSVKGGEFIR